MSGWTRPIITDSGGFQAYSLIHQNPRQGSLNDQGISYTPENGSHKYQLTPEKSIQLQIAFGADIVICLDDCTHVDASLVDQENSVHRTIAWARRSRAEFDKLMDTRHIEPENQPRLFAVIQGGGYPHLRKTCAQALLEIGFDGFGFGGWPLDHDGNLLADMIALARQLVPPTYPMHALGVGHPRNVQVCHALGYDLFDSAMPTRDARHGRLYCLTNPGYDGDWLKYLYIQDEQHVKSADPLDLDCDCLCCRRYSRGYLHHLFKAGDSLFFRLATIHNVRFMTRLTSYLTELKPS
jgi:queuine tRNA-ribosyltransferase